MKTKHICLNCPSFRNGCRGPNLADMDVPEAFEFLEDVRIWLGWSYQKIADDTGIAVGNVKANLTRQVKNPSVATLFALNKVLVSAGRGLFPCLFAETDADALKLRGQIAELEAKLADMEAKKEHFKTLSKEYLAQNHIKDQQLIEKDKQIEWRSVAMQERWQVIKWQKEDLDKREAEIEEQKAFIKKLMAEVERLKGETQ